MGIDYFSKARPRLAGNTHERTQYLGVSLISWRKRSSWQPEIMMDQPLKNPQDTGKKWGFWREPGQMEKALAALEFESCLECLLFFFFFFYSFFNSSTLLSIHISELHNILKCGTRLRDVRGGPWPLGPGYQGVSDMRLSS